MILDGEKQRKILLQIINTTNFPGSVLQEALELKKAIINAKIGEEKDKK